MTSLVEARADVMLRRWDGVTCPCCDQLAKIYRRKITSGAAKQLIAFYRRYHLEWGHAPSLPGLSKVGGEWARLSCWGLIKESDEAREDGGRAGWWQVTEIGEAFVKGRLTVPKYGWFYDGQLLELDDIGTASISDALGEHFSYEDLMAGV